MYPVNMGMDIPLPVIIHMSKGGMMMSFLSNSICQYSNCKPILEKTSLQAYPKKTNYNSRKPKYLYSKRMSSFLLSNMEGSMTVEASIAIPVFLFAILNLLSIILLFGEYSSNLADMHQKAKELSVHAHILENGQDVNNDLIILSKAQKLEPVISFMGFEPARTIVNCRVRKWTGYDTTQAVMEKIEEEWVYITPSGEAYHRDRNCSYLNPKILTGVTANMKTIRNKDGEIYRLCNTCKDGSLTGICFYTEYGNRYHTTLECSGIKRTIESVKISETEGRHACGKCGREK